MYFWTLSNKIWQPLRNNATLGIFWVPCWVQEFSQDKHKVESLNLEQGFFPPIQLYKKPKSHTKSVRSTERENVEVSRIISRHQNIRISEDNPYKEHKQIHQTHEILQISEDYK